MHVLNRFNIDLAKKQTPIVINAMQNDVNSRIIEAHLFANSVPWDVPTDASASIAFKNLKDGHKGWYDKLPDGTSATTANNNTVVATLSPAVLSSEGEVSAAIIFQDKQLNQIATFVFSIFVEPNPSDGESIVNDYYKYSTLEQVSEAVDEWLTKTNNEKNEFLDDANNALYEIREVVINSENAPAIICEETGRFVSVDNSSNRLLHGLNIYGKTTQDGTPTPDNPVELVSAGASGAINTTVAGKNLFALIDNDTTTENGITVAKDKASGKVTLNGTATARRTARLGIITADSNMEIILSGSSSFCELWLTNSDGSSIVATSTGGNSTKYKMTKGESYRVYACVYSGTVCNNVVISPMIRLASVADATFEPYKETQTITVSTPNGLNGIPVASGGNYTDENGQHWICDEIDFARGVYVKRLETLALKGTEGIWGTETKVAGRMRFALTLGNNKEFSPNEVASGLCCNYYRSITEDSVYNGEQGISLGSMLWIGDMRFADATAFNANLATLYAEGNPVTIMYQLAEPTETPLSAEELAQYAALHTNKPTTTVYNDAGAGMTVGYVADTKMYIDNKLAAISAAVLNA